MHQPYHQSRRRRVPVTLITAADGVCHPTSAALIISRRSIYPDCGNADHKWTKTIKEIEKLGQSSRQRLYLIAGGRDWLQRRVEIARVSVRQTLDGHGRQSRPLGWSFMRWQQAHVVASCNGCPRCGGGVERDPLVGLMLAGQQSRPPAMTIRRWRGNWF